LGKLLKTSGCPFSFDDWAGERIIKVFAGLECVMALTADGVVLQKVLDDALAARTEFWKNIKDISLSNCFPSLAVGLLNDGTCMVSKRPLRKICEMNGIQFDDINNRIKALRDIVEVAVSDAVFALDKYGRVHHIALSRYDNYNKVETFENVDRIITGNQCAVFCITKDSKVLCDGSNCVSGPHGELKNTLSGVDNVADICVMGSECEQIVLAFKDATVKDLFGDELDFKYGFSPCKSNFCLSALSVGDGFVKFIDYSFPAKEELEEIEKTAVSSFAVGIGKGFTPFAVAVKK